MSKPERFSGDNVIYKPVGETVPDMVFLGSLTNFDLTYAWVQDKCVPLVREITFENGEVKFLFSFYVFFFFFYTYRFSPSTLLGTPVPLFIHAVI